MGLSMSGQWQEVGFFATVSIFSLQAVLLTR